MDGTKEYKELAKDMMIDNMLKSLDAIASSSEDVRTRAYAEEVAKLNRDMLEKLSKDR
ncbi:hypothetical protein [Paenibacillus naphthalenovorans]|uniref:hypothetical protein n=1 Tax=Paenibacillus naphthalenovorans TaxID=162209 RepID=UPI0008903FB7|nr:hypothetical protein [Paenibacillus naphthalenovorans]SDJ61202.1 hypothetical protein SAMN05421868_13436 [Paenibacillus naphthalenovorans]